jgi:hypothetical protein
LESPSGDRRRPGTRQVLFRSTVGQVLALLENLPPNPTQDDLEPIRTLLTSAQIQLKGDRKLDHKMRNILTIAGLSTEAASPAETVEWIKQVVRD